MDKPTTGLLDRTYTLLTLSRKRFTLREIAVGAGVKYDWLSKFANEQIPNPGIVNVQAVHDFLSAAKDAA